MLSLHHGSWTESKWLRWKIDYLETRAVIKYKIEVTESGLVLISIKDILSKGWNSNISAFYSSPIYSSSSRSSKNKSRSFSIITLDIFSVEEEGAGGQGADVDIEDLDLFFDDLEEDE